MRMFRVLFGLSVVLGATLAAGTASAHETYGSATLSAIETARAAGEIGDAEATLYRLYFVKASAKLPTRFTHAVQGEERIKCGTEIVAEAKAELDRLPVWAQHEVQTLLARPTLNAFIDTAHYRVHYSTTGASTIWQWPNTDYRDAIMQSCEDSWTFFHVTKNWQVPPSDGTAGGGSNLIDCYVDELTGVYGVTYPENSGPNWPNDMTAYFVIDNDYTGFGYTDRTLPMKVTVAHEYHHVVQMGYTTANPWWMEQVSTFMEDEVYDAIDDNYAYLSSFLAVPYKKLSTFAGTYQYGAFLWPTYIKEQFDHDLVRQIQECAATTVIFNCLDNVFTGQGTTFAAEQAQFNVWNFYTSATRDDGQHYIEGGTYPTTMAYDKQYTSYPQSAQHPTASKAPEATGCSVIRFRPETGSTDNVLRIDYDGPNCVEQVAFVMKEAGGPVFTEYYLNLDANGNGTIDLPGWDGAEYCHMISSMPRDCGNGTFDYVFDADTDTQVGITEHPALFTRTIDLRQNAPNPMTASTEIRYRLAVDGPVRIEIYDASGRVVRHLVNAVSAAGDHHVLWDGRDDQTRVAAPGVYFYRLSNGIDTETRKLLVVE